MQIIKTASFHDSLENILSYIAQDNVEATIKFDYELSQKIEDLKDFPFMYHKSYYFDNEYIRDLTHKGYTIPYEVDLEKRYIYSWNNKI